MLNLSTDRGRWGKTKKGTLQVPLKKEALNLKQGNGKCNASYKWGH